MKVRVLTDSTIDIDPGIIQSLEIKVVPIYVRFGERVYRDGVDITRREFYDLLQNSPDHPATS
jgi:fatty acid-binding protein DegV